MLFNSIEFLLFFAVFFAIYFVVERVGAKESLF